MSDRILIVEGMAVNRILLRSRLRNSCYDVDLAQDGRSGLKAALARPDLILLDANLPDTGLSGFMSRLRATGAGRDVPVIVLSESDAPEDRIAAFAAGADDVLSKLTDEQTLLARLRSLLRHRSETPDPDGGLTAGLAESGPGFEAPALIGLVAGRPEAALRLRNEIGPFLGDRLVPVTREDLLGDRAAETRVPDVIIVDPGPDGPEAALLLASELRSRPQTRNLGIAVIFPARSSTRPVLAYDVGVNDIWPAGIGGKEAALRLKRLVHRKRQSDQARSSVEDRLRLAHRDPLTGLHNRRYALPRLSAIAAQCRATSQPFAVMVVDLDRFKTVNDCFGHAAGDTVLVEIARRLQAETGEGDLIARIGGEEFLLAFPAMALPEAEDLAARICHSVEASPVRLADDTCITVTVSVGLAIAKDASPESPDLVVDRADRALLAAKSAGRNQVTVGRSAA